MLQLENKIMNVIGTGNTTCADYFIIYPSKMIYNKIKMVVKIHGIYTRNKRQYRY